MSDIAKITTLHDDAVLYLGDCLDVLRTFEDNSFDSIVTDPPAGISFMGKSWDGDKGGRDNWIKWMTEIARECLRVLKPGGHALVWSLPRTSHWTATAWEDAGFEPRDRIAHVFGSGFPKGTDVSKQIDKAAGAEREVVGINNDYLCRKPNGMKTAGATVCAYSQMQHKTDARITTPATDAASQWDGWNTALKPAVEDWWLFRKPIEGAVYNNVLKWGVGAINIDDCRIEMNDTEPLRARKNGTSVSSYKAALRNEPMAGDGNEWWEGGNTKGRWPSNIILDGSDEVIALFPDSKGQQGDVRGTELSRTGGEGTNCYGEHGRVPSAKRGDSGSAARFFKSCPPDDPLEDVEVQRIFYCAKASKRDRNEGCEVLEPRKSGMSNGAQIHGDGYDKGQDIGLNRVILRHNHHPTVKATSLMRYLCRLITPPNGIVLDPFVGSGSTGKAAILEGFRFVGIDKDEDSVIIAKCRVEWAQRQGEFPEAITIETPQNEDVKQLALDIKE